MTISHAEEPALSVDAFIDLLRRSTLAERRPVEDRDRVAGMLRHADIIVTARNGDALVGVSRALTDFAYCCYLSDLAVDTAYQRRGIGRELIGRTHAAAGPETTLVLLSAPAAMAYYARIGMHPIDNGWKIDRER